MFNPNLSEKDFREDNHGQTALYLKYSDDCINYPIQSSNWRTLPMESDLQKYLALKERNKGRCMTFSKYIRPVDTDKLKLAGTRKSSCVKQEAYRPPCSEYSFCCPDRVPPPPDRVPPWGGTWPGTPPRGVPGHPPGGYLTGYPLGGVPGPPRCLMAFWEMLQSIMGYGYPPQVWTDKQSETITFPSY